MQRIEDYAVIGDTQTAADDRQFSAGLLTTPQRRTQLGREAMIRALTAEPGVANSARIEELDAPPGDGDILVEAVAVGVCGTDREIVAGTYGVAPAGRSRIVLGHESVGRVVQAPGASDSAPGDLVVGIVRRPDPVPCASCAAGEWDMCCNGRYTERGINARDGFAADQWCIEPQFAVRVDPRLGELAVLLEPASVVAKAWEQIERIVARSIWRPSKVLVTGAGPVGLLAALLGVQRGLDVHVLDRVTTGPKPELVRDLGASYHAGSVAEVMRSTDIVLECTGAPQLVIDTAAAAPPNGIICLTGVSSGRRRIEVDVGSLNNEIVLENNVVFGTVNANRRHYQSAHRALLQADDAWLGKLITRRVPLEGWYEALTPRPDDVKSTLTFDPSRWARIAHARKR